MMSGAWLIRLKTGKSGWIDAIWSLSIALTGLIASWAPFDWSNLTPRQLIIGFCVLVAYSRLALDICYRTARSGDDPRYLALEKIGVKVLKLSFIFSPNPGFLRIYIMLCYLSCC